VYRLAAKAVSSRVNRVVLRTLRGSGTLDALCTMT
jgi:hypothetical protein